MKLEYGCDKDSPIPGKWRVGDVVFQRCPLKMVSNDVLPVLEVYNIFRLGILPNSGGWFDQSAKFTQAAMILLSEDAKISKEDLHA